MNFKIFVYKFWSLHLALSDINKQNENRSRNEEEAIFVIFGINLHKLPYLINGAKSQNSV